MPATSNPTKIMKTSLLKSCIFLATLPALLVAQTATSSSSVPAPGESPAAPPAEEAVSFQADAPSTPRELRSIRGVQELTFGGSGGVDRGFNDSFGGATVGYGVYFNNEWQGAIRQSLNYNNPDVGATRWSGSTRVAMDYHFTELGMAMPFVGASFGRVYGDAVHDTWTAGLEAGLKYYVRRQVFVFAMVEYSWFFERGRQLDNNFDEGQFGWSTGVGFNF